MEPKPFAGKLSRRDFLKAAGWGSLMMALKACAPRLQPTPESPVPPISVPDSPTPVPSPESVNNPMVEITPIAELDRLAEMRGDFESSPVIWYEHADEMIEAKGVQAGAASGYVVCGGVEVSLDGQPTAEFAYVFSEGGQEDLAMKITGDGGDVWVVLDYQEGLVLPGGGGSLQGYGYYLEGVFYPVLSAEVNQSGLLNGTKWFYDVRNDMFHKIEEEKPGKSGAMAVVALANQHVFEGKELMEEPGNEEPDLKWNFGWRREDGALVINDGQGREMYGYDWEKKHWTVKVEKDVGKPEEPKVEEVAIEVVDSEYVVGLGKLVGDGKDAYKWNGESGVWERMPTSAMDAELLAEIAPLTPEERQAYLSSGYAEMIEASQIAQGEKPNNFSRVMLSGVVEGTAEVSLYGLTGDLADWGTVAYVRPATEVAAGSETADRVLPVLIGWSYGGAEWRSTLIVDTMGANQSDEADPIETRGTIADSGNVDSVLGRGQAVTVKILYGFSSEVGDVDWRAQTYDSGRPEWGVEDVLLRMMKSRKDTYLHVLSLPLHGTNPENKVDWRKAVEIINRGSGGDVGLIPLWVGLPDYGEIEGLK